MPESRNHICWPLALGLLVAAAWLFCAATPATAATSRGPDEVIDFSADRRVSDLVITSDGQSAYVVQVDRGVNVWSLCVHHWAIIIGFGLFFVLLWIALRFRRLWRQRRYARLEPHCKRCGYQLTGLTSDSCPECGTALNKQNVVIGRNVRRRLIVLTILGVCLLGTYAGGFIVQASFPYGPFSPYSVSGWFVLQSHTLGRWQQQYKIAWLGQFVMFSSYISKVDLVAGGSRQALYHGDYSCITSIRFSEDEARCYAVDVSYPVTLKVFQTKPFGPVISPYVYGIDDRASNVFVSGDEKSLYYIDADGAIHQAPLDGQPWSSWTDSGVKVAAFFQIKQRSYGSVAARDQIWAGLLNKDRLWGLQDRSHIKVWRLEDGSQLVDIQLQFGQSVGVASRQEKSDRVYVATYSRTSKQYGPVEVWDLNTGKLLETIVGPQGEKPAEIDMSPGGRYFYVWEYGKLHNQIHVRDETTGQWIESFDVPAGKRVHRLEISRDGTLLTAVVWEGYHSQILVYRVPHLIDPAKRPAQDSNTTSPDAAVVPQNNDK